MPANRKLKNTSDQHAGHALRVDDAPGYRTQLLFCSDERRPRGGRRRAPTTSRGDRPCVAVRSAPASRCSAPTTAGPLSRTVKRIIDPLVLRLRANTKYSAPFVTADVAAEMHEAIVGQAATLRATAEWFDLLKRERRRLRITTGNAQELYFPVCFELAVRQGRTRTARIATRPSGICATSTPTATAPRSRCSTSTSATMTVVAALSAQLARSWRDVRAGHRDHRSVPGRADDGAGPGRRTQRHRGASAGVVGAGRRRDAVQPRRRRAP